MSKVLKFYGCFLISFSRIGYRLRGLPNRPAFPELSGKRILITGATDGVGAALARLAAHSGAEAHAVGRSQEKLDALVAAAPEAGAIRAWWADLSSGAETLALVSQLQAAGARFDGLINNVGVLNHAYEATVDGVERMYAINILLPYLMTEAIFKADLFNQGAVIANMASGGLYNAPQNVAYLEQDETRFNGFAAYATHKRAQIVLSNAWTAEHAHVNAYTLHPGWANTPGVERSLPKFHKTLRVVLRTPAQGADTALWLIVKRPHPIEGALWFDRKARSAHAYKTTRTPLARDAEVLERLKTDAQALGDRLGALGSGPVSPS